MTDAAQKNYLSLPLKTFLDDLASTAPTPGGGSTAALTGSLGASLGHMVAGYALKRAQKQNTDTAPITHIMNRLQRAAQLLSGLIAEDIAAYDLYRQVSKLDPNAPGTTEQKQVALLAALAIPNQILAVSAACLRDMAALAPLSSRYLWTDLAGAAQMSLAAAEAAAWTVYANLSSPELVEDERKQMSQEVKHQQEAANKACKEVTNYVRTKVIEGK